jgi:REP element-mobilizing transposase RayT
MSIFDSVSRKYKFNDDEGIYFISFAVVNWIDVFVRKEYKNKIIESLEYCVKEKGLIIYAYVIMSNHIHLLIGKSNVDISFSDIMRDLKKYTSMHLLKMIKEHNQESRKEWMLDLFLSAGEKNSNNKKYQFWQQNNQPILLSFDDKIDKAIDYIHENPVKAGFVLESSEYLYSSARNYFQKDSVMKIMSIYDGTEI